MDESSADVPPPDRPTSAAPGYEPPPAWEPPNPATGGAQPPVTLDGFSVAGLIFGILPTVPLGLIFGITGLVRTSHRARRGRTLAIVGLLLSALWLVVIAAAGLAGRHDSGQPDAQQQTSATVAVPSPSTTSTNAISPRDLQPGDCFMLGSDGHVATIPLLPCSQPHDAQAYANLQIPYRPYAGPAKTFDAAIKVCEPAARSYLNGHTGLLRVAAFYPTDVAWAIGDYTAHCILYDPRHNFVGDARHHY